MPRPLHLSFFLLLPFLVAAAAPQETRITLSTRTRQPFDGLGVGAIFYEAHITSLSARDKQDRQEKLYDDMFTHLNVRYLQLMIRETHEPENDNPDPLTLAFDDKNFAYCQHTLAIAKAALKRRPDIQLFATLYTPPPWMKTNNAASAGGPAKATLKDNLDTELAEYCFAFLAHMAKNGAPIQYLAIANEPDWPHDQPGYFLTPDKHATLFKAVADHLDKLCKKYPDVPRPKLVGPNTLSAPGAAKDYVPRTLRTAGKSLDVIATHDYDPRGDRFGDLKRLAPGKPLWMTEWCARKQDSSPGMINSATDYGAALHDALKGGVNAWFAYDYAYPPRTTGEALIHIDWGNDYTLTKPYHLLRQFASPLTPGMKVAEATTFPADSPIKATSFLSPDGKTLILHLLNPTDAAVAVTTKLPPRFTPDPTTPRTRTSAMEDLAPLPALPPNQPDPLPPRSLTTYIFKTN